MSTTSRPDPPHCPKCSAASTRIVGQSGTPPIVYYRCDRCEYVFSRPLGTPTPPELAA